MKQVIKNTEYVNASAATDKKYYGVTNGSRGFITKERWKSSTYIVKCASSVTNGNEWVAFTSNSLTNLIEQLIYEGFKIYEFDTYQELFAWLGYKN